MASTIPVIAVSGGHREIGRQIGEAAREQIRRSVAYYEENIEWLAGMRWAEAERRSLALLPDAEHDLPQYAAELAGMAAGAAVRFESLLVLNCGEEILCAERPAGGPAVGASAAGVDTLETVVARPSDRCTCIAIAAPGRTVIGHNEDWIEDDVENMILLDLTTAAGTRILSMTGAAYLPQCGVNSHGLAFYGNTLYSRDERAGVPNTFKHRWLLESRTRVEADARARLRGRARGSNHLNAREGGEIWDLEVSAERDALVEPTAAAFGEAGSAAWLAHTNHFTAAEMSDLERSTSEGSRRRLERARALVPEGLARGDDPLDIIRGALSDHAHAPTSICAHPVPDDPEHGPTTGSIVVELEERRLHVCAGRPCENEYLTVSFA
jgi:isopenicillin-N N-acyltransferase-like protein